MKIPKKIKICGYDFKVKDHHFEAGTHFGLLKYQSLTIYIEKDAKQQVREEAFIHEIIHGIDYATGKELDEDKISALSRALYYVLKDNNLLKEGD